MLRFPRTSSYRPLSPAERPQRTEDLRFQRTECRELVSKIKRVAVVGGGLAGLMAALRLSQYGVKVTVFEAHEEVGGRVRSNVTFSKGRITEEGAELIGSFHTTWLGLALKYGLAVVSRMDPELYQREGLDVKLTLDKPLSMDEFLKLTKEMNNRVLLPIALLAKLIKDPSRPWEQKWLKKDWPMSKLDNMSVAEALEKIFKVKRDGQLWKFIEFKLVNDEVAPLDEMNFLGLLCKVRGGQGERFGKGLAPLLMGYWDELEIFRCADGCQELARKMEEEINRQQGCRVDRSRMVKVINISNDKDADQVKVTWVPVRKKKPDPGPGQSEYFEFVILAIPPSVWGGVEIIVNNQKVDPEAEIGKVGMDPAVKFFTDVKDRFWIKQKAAPYGGSLAIGQVWEGTDNQTRVNRDPQGRPLNNDEKQGIVLSVFAGPILPGRNVPNEKNFKDGLKQLYPDYNDVHTKPPLFSNWPIEPFIETGYVSPKKKQILTIGQEFSKPFHYRLFFAGEHTQMDFFGYMEGALRSGERAAHTLMLKKCGLLKEPAPKSPSRTPQRPAPKSPTPTRVARATPTRETTAFEREVGARLKEHSSVDHPGEAESPFLNQVRFAKKSEEEWEPRAAALVAESPFLQLNSGDFEEEIIDERLDISEFQVEPVEEELVEEESVGEELDALRVREEPAMRRHERPVFFQHDLPQSSAQVVVVGQRVELDLNNIEFAKESEDIKWTIPGVVVRGYDGTAKDAKLFKLTDVDLQRPKISFFWVDAADGRIVLAKFRLKSGGLGQVAFAFDVKGPTVSDFTARTDVTRLEKSRGLLGMRFGKLIESPGIKWHWKISLPPTHEGYIKDVQTVLNDRTKILLLRAGGRDTRKLAWRHPSKTDPHLQVDGDPDGPEYTKGLFEEKRAAGSSFTNKGTSDSPHTELPSLAKTVSVNDQFTYYVMFKPAMKKDHDAIWVPVAKAKWFWKVTATRRDKKWLLSQPKPKMEATITLATTDFPIYETNAFENEWREVSP